MCREEVGSRSHLQELKLFLYTMTTVLEKIDLIMIILVAFHRVSEVPKFQNPAIPLYLIDVISKLKMSMDCGYHLIFIDL